VQPAPALSSPPAHTGSLARISHSSPSLSHLENQTRPVPPSPPSNPTLPYLTYPTQINPLTHHSLTTNQPTNSHQSSETGTPPLPYLCASFIYSPFPPPLSQPAKWRPPTKQPNTSPLPASNLRLQHPNGKKARRGGS
jgi:hypothetical protein